MFSTVYFEIGSYTEPGTHGFHKISCPASPRDLPALPPHHWDYRHMSLCQAFLLYPCLHIMKYNHIYPHFPPSILPFSLTSLLNSNPFPFYDPLSSISVAHVCIKNQSSGQIYVDSYQIPGLRIANVPRKAGRSSWEL